MDRNELIKLMQATAAAASRPRAVTVPGWGTVYVRDVTLEEVDARIDARKASAADDGSEVKRNSLAVSVAQVLCDEDGKRYLDERSSEDLALLAGQPWPLMQRLLDAADSTKAVPGNA